MRRAAGITAVLLSFALAVPGAWAARTRFHTLAESTYYKEKMGGMLGRGALNIVTSFVDILVNTVDETKAGPPFIGTLVGLAKGTGCGLLRLGSGAVDVVTFWVPGFNGFPVSDSYDNCLAQGTSAGVVTIPEASLSPAVWESEPIAEPVAQLIEEPVEPVKPAKKTWEK